MANISEGKNGSNYFSRLANILPLAVLTLANILFLPAAELMSIPGFEG